MKGFVGTAKVLLGDEIPYEEISIAREDFKVQIIEYPTLSKFCRIKFYLEIQDNNECALLEDYTGLVRPVLEKNIRGLITSVEILNIKEMGVPPLVHFSKIFKKPY